MRVVLPNQYFQKVRLRGAITSLDLTSKSPRSFVRPQIGMVSLVLRMKPAQASGELVNAGSKTALFSGIASIFFMLTLISF
jgi:hypothetical protein